MAPPHYWHVHEIGKFASWAHENVGEVRPWLTAVPPWLHFYEVCYHVRAADVLGFHAALFLTGHYGANWRDLKTVLELMQPHTATRLYGLPDFEANVPGFDGDGSAGDHAGKVETSLLWSVEPDCVDMSRLPPAADAAGRPHFAMGKNAFAANRRIGDRMVEDEARWLGEKARELMRSYRPEPNRAPLTIAAVEEIWAREIEPKIPDFASLELDRAQPPDGSRWRADWAIPKRFRK